MVNVRTNVIVNSRFGQNVVIVRNDIRIINRGNRFFNGWGLGGFNNRFDGINDGFGQRIGFDDRIDGSIGRLDGFNNFDGFYASPFYERGCCGGRYHPYAYSYPSYPMFI